VGMIAELKQLNHPIAFAIAAFFVGLVAPGALVLFIFKPELFESIDTAKLVILSVSLSGPGIFLPYMTTIIAVRAAQRILRPLPTALFGSYLEWFVGQSLSNGVSMYLALTIAYIGSLTARTFITIFASLIALASLSEIFRVIRTALTGEKQPSLIGED
jgi:hypothetical protein